MGIRRVGGTDGIPWRRVLSVVGAATALLVWVTLTAYGGNPVDAWDYWVDPSHPYATPDVHHYLYSPVFAQVLAPFHLLGFETYVAFARAVELICAFWLAGPALAFALFLPPVATEINAANINVILVVAIALGFRWPALWAVVLLTKPTMGRTNVATVGRRAWRDAGGPSVVLPQPRHAPGAPAAAARSRTRPPAEGHLGAEAAANDRSIA